MRSLWFLPGRFLLPWTCALAACGTGSPTNSGSMDMAGGPGSGCPLSAQTTATSTVTNGCALLSRDTSSCTAARTAQGLSGGWLKFSCRVTLTMITNAGTAEISAQSDGQPDYTSNYFAATNACYAAYTPSFPDPNQIRSQTLTIRAQKVPNTTNTTQGLGPVGMAINGVAIFDNQAAPGDDIYKEAGSFDRCGGHPAPDGTYHYHGEPYSISSNDSNLIGVLKDGYFIYGRKDSDGSTPTLDARGGHTGTTVDSATPVYHYHVNQQTSMNAGTAGQMQYFLTTGTYEGSPAP